MNSEEDLFDRSSPARTARLLSSWGDNARRATAERARRLYDGCHGNDVSDPRSARSSDNEDCDSAGDRELSCSWRCGVPALPVGAREIRWLSWEERVAHRGELRGASVPVGERALGEPNLGGVSCHEPGAGTREGPRGYTSARLYGCRPSSLLYVGRLPGQTPA